MATKFHNWTVHFSRCVFQVWTQALQGSSHWVWGRLKSSFLWHHISRASNTPWNKPYSAPSATAKLCQASTGKLGLIYAVASRNDQSSFWRRGEQWVCQHSPFWVEIQKQACWQLLWNCDSTGSHPRLYMDSNRVTVLGTESLFKECTIYFEEHRNHYYIHSWNNPLLQVVA